MLGINLLRMGNFTNLEIILRNYNLNFCLYKNILIRIN